MKLNKITYLFTFIVLVSICMVSFNATFKLMKQSSITIVDEEIEDNEVDDDEFEKDDKIVCNQICFNVLNGSQASVLWQNVSSDLNSTEMKIDSPPPKI